MRLSCRPHDDGYEAYVRLMAGNTFQFFIDGVEVDNVITADDEEGLLLVYARDSDGKILFAPEGAVTEHRAGTVCIAINPRP